MSDTATPSNSSENIGSPSPSAPPITTGSPEWRAPAHSPFAGRSSDEVLGALEMAAAQLAKFNQTPQTPEAPKNRFDYDLPADDSEYLQVGQVRRLINQMANQPAPVDEHARNLAAQAVYGNIRTSRAEEFRRWQPEIDAEIRRLPVPYWTYEALNTIVNMVRANHVDELVAEKAQRLRDESHPTIRSGTGGSGGVTNTQQRSLESDTLPKGWVDRARSLGIDEGTVREFAALQGISPDDYLADVEKYGKNGAVIRG